MKQNFLRNSVGSNSFQFGTHIDFKKTSQIAYFFFNYRNINRSRAWGGVKTCRNPLPWKKSWAWCKFSGVCYSHTLSKDSHRMICFISLPLKDTVYYNSESFAYECLIWLSKEVTGNFHSLWTRSPFHLWDFKS